MIQLVSLILEAFKSSMDFTKEVQKSVDEEKFSRSVNQMYGQPPTYDEWDEALKIIVADNSIETKEKIDLIKVVTEEKEKAKKRELDDKERAAKIIDEHNKNKMKVAEDVALGVATGGVSLVANGVKNIIFSDKNK